MADIYCIIPHFLAKKGLYSIILLELVGEPLGQKINIKFHRVGGATEGLKVDS